MSDNNKNVEPINQQNSNDNDEQKGVAASGQNQIMERPDQHPFVYSPESKSLPEQIKQDSKALPRLIHWKTDEVSDYYLQQPNNIKETIKNKPLRSIFVYPIVHSPKLLAKSFALPWETVAKAFQWDKQLIKENKTALKMEYEAIRDSNLDLDNPDLPDLDNFDNVLAYWGINPDQLDRVKSTFQKLFLIYMVLFLFVLLSTIESTYFPWVFGIPTSLGLFALLTFVSYRLFVLMGEYFIPFKTFITFGLYPRARAMPSTRVVENNGYQ